MRGETARLAGDVVPVHPDQEGQALTGPPATSGSSDTANADVVESASAIMGARSFPRTIPRRGGSEKRRRTVHFAVRLTPDERSAIEGAAERAGLSTGSYARQVLLGAPAPRQVRRPPVERKELARLLGEIGHVGGNLNQLAHMANTGRPTDRKALLVVLQSLVEVRNAILVALGRMS